METIYFTAIYSTNDIEHAKRMTSLNTLNELSQNKSTDKKTTQEIWNELAPLLSKYELKQFNNMANKSKG